VPDLMSTGMGVKIGDTVVIIARTRMAPSTENNSKFPVSWEAQPDREEETATSILRMRWRSADGGDGSERIGHPPEGFRTAPCLQRQTRSTSFREVNKQGKSIYHVSTWEELSPFYNISRMIDMMAFFIKLMLIAVVLVSIMNVMIMAVYERIREIVRSPQSARCRERFVRCLSWRDCFSERWERRLAF